jgi:hypothetical protein
MGEYACQQLEGARQTIAAMTAATDPARAAWALGVHWSQHACWVVGILHGGPAVPTDLGPTVWAGYATDPGRIVRCTYDRQTTRFFDHQHARRPFLAVRHAMVDALLRNAPITAGLRAELETSAQLAGLGRTDAERSASSQRAYTAGAMAWETARPPATLLDLIRAAA